MGLKILYALQGTGNGHAASAREIIPILETMGEVDVFLAGDQSQVNVPGKRVKRSKGFTFVYNAQGGISIPRTILKNNVVRWLWEVLTISMAEYDVIINDFESITAWAGRIRGYRVVGLGHQFALKKGDVPWPRKTDLLGQAVLKWYAPVADTWGFHFKSNGKRIFTPVIRREVRNQQPEDRGFFMTYLPAVGLMHLLPVLEKTRANWKVFSKEVNSIQVSGGVTVYPIDAVLFSDSLARCTGILTSAGFETPAESLFLGKKLAVVPIKGQFEQFINAEGLRELGVPVWEEWSGKVLPDLLKWMEAPAPERRWYPDQTQRILEQVVENETQMAVVSTVGTRAEKA